MGYLHRHQQPSNNEIPILAMQTDLHTADILQTFLSKSSRHQTCPKELTRHQPLACEAMKAVSSLNRMTIIDLQSIK